MAYVVERKPGASGGRRFEIRESVATDRGPRARSLATFGVLDDAVLARARARALRPLADADVVAGARRLGAPVDLDRAADRLARALLVECAAGRPPAPVLMSLLRDALGSGPPVGDNVDAAAGWLGTPDADRGRALADLLDLADALDSPRPPDALVFPRLTR